MLVLLLTMSLFLAVLVVMLQTEPVRELLVERIEDRFNRDFQGTLQIGELGGLLPFDVRLDQVTLSNDNQIVAEVSSVRFRVDMIALLRNHLSIGNVTLQSPQLRITPGQNGRSSFAEALSRIDGRPAAAQQTFANIDIYAPFVQIADGSLFLNYWPRNSGYDPPIRLPLQVEALYTEMFVEFSEIQRYLDITYLTMEFPDRLPGQLALSGQVYNDSRYLELNAFRMQVGQSHIDWSVDFEGINLLAEDLPAQFSASLFALDVDDLFLAPQEAFLLTEHTPAGFAGIKASFEATGDADELRVEHARIQSGQTGGALELLVRNYRSRPDATLQATLSDWQTGPDEWALFVQDPHKLPVTEWSDVLFSAQLQATTDSLAYDVSVTLPEGSLQAVGHMSTAAPIATSFRVDVQQFNLAALDTRQELSTKINAQANGLFRHTTANGPELIADMHLTESSIGAWMLEDITLDALYSSQTLRYDLSLFQQEHFLQAQGQVYFEEQVPHFILRGTSEGLDLSTLNTTLALPETRWNTSFDVNWHGTDRQAMYGRLVIDILPSLVNQIELPAHQLYVDLNSPIEQERSFRLTSSVADLVVEGNLTASDIAPLTEYWGWYVRDRINDEFFFATSPEPMPSRPDYATLQADLFLELKNLPLLSVYIPALPRIESNARLQMSLLADADSLLVDADWHAPHSEWNGLQAHEARFSLQTALHHAHTLREKVRADASLQVEYLRQGDRRFEGFFWELNLLDDRLVNRIQLDRFANNVRFLSAFESRLNAGEILTRVDDMIIGSQIYTWRIEGEPVIRWRDDAELRIDEFVLASGQDRVLIDGVYGQAENDSIMVRLDNINLTRISSMIDGRVGFEGILNAGFKARLLDGQPVLDGNARVDGLALDGRPLGDVTFQGDLDTTLNRLETAIHVRTDPENYADYLSENNNTGQDVYISGWIRPPGDDISQTPLFYDFDVDAREIDLWFLEYLLQTIFLEVEGRGTGNGRVFGDFSRIDFEGDFQILGAEVVPVFFETRYELQGDVSVSRSNGVQLDGLQARDRQNGTGQVTGRFDFNDFQAERFMDFTLRMNNLLFLENTGAPEIPFYGTVAGTGVVNISGSNITPFVRTLEPINTTSGSRLSIPLAEQVMMQDYGRTIRFVRDFSEIDRPGQQIIDPEVIRQADRTFMETFRLDLQFVAAPNSVIQLIFDPVTGEIVNARGSGRMRISLEDENLQIFGNFDISDGDYLFIGGDILARRFTLREGGTLRWDGDPANALLDILAVYRTRPNISPLLGGAIDQVNRVPVDLLLEITGPLDNIENDFYFEFPNAIDASQNAAVLNVLNSEEQKLIQATSLLFTGGFISGTLVGDTQTQELGSTLQARAGQVGISQLLSSQINALLSDNLLNVDVDLNLFGFDQADLGIALRLFDDRLVLRREGEVGGEETNIGDLGATYRINPNLSVEVFHRKDPMLLSILGAQAEVENVNGVGLEAQFRFNSWREFSRRIWNNITSVFSRGSSANEQASQNQTTQPDEQATQNQASQTDGQVSQNQASQPDEQTSQNRQSDQSADHTLQSAVYATEPEQLRITDF